MNNNYFYITIYSSWHHHPPCFADINDCSPDPCASTGTCQDQVNGYMCDCDDGYDGTLCDNNIDECSSNPCASTGTCSDGVNRFSCLCDAGYEGTLCDTGMYYSFVSVWQLGIYRDFLYWKTHYQCIFLISIKALFPPMLINCLRIFIWMGVVCSFFWWEKTHYSSAPLISSSHKNRKYSTVAGAHNSKLFLLF